MSIKNFGLWWRNEINIPKGICDDCDEHDFDRLYNASIIHEKPLTNAAVHNINKFSKEEK